MARGDDAAWLLWDPEFLPADEIDAAWDAVLSARARGDRTRELNVYTHFAYCRRSCAFCMYHHEVPRGSDPYVTFVDALVARLARIRDAHGRVQASHAYWGGGTPTAVPPHLLQRLLAAFCETFALAGEFAVEAHPVTLEPDFVPVLARHGVNRLSVGLQSLDRAVLETITRRNRPLDAVQALVTAARDASIAVNLDLVAGLPGQTLTSLRSDIVALAGLAPDFVTVYAFQPVASLRVPPSPEFAAANVFDDALVDAIGALGYFVVSTSNGSVLRRGVRPADGLGAAAGPRGAQGEIAYHQYGGPPADLLGLAPGAESHVWGRFRYRSVTTQSSFAQGSIYLGTRTGEGEERWHRARRALARGGRAPRPDTTWGHGDRLAAFHSALDSVVWAEEDAADGRSYVRFSAGASEQERLALLRAASPRPPAGTRLPLTLAEWPEGADRRFGARLGGHAGDAGVGPADAGSGSAPSPTLAAWLSLFDPDEGAPTEILGVAVAGWSGDLVALRVDASSAPLEVSVEPAGERDSFCSTPRFAMSHWQRTGAPMSQTELAFLRALCAEVLRLDAAAA